MRVAPDDCARSRRSRAPRAAAPRTRSLNAAVPKPAAASADGVGAGRDRVVALRADGEGELGARVLAGLQARERVGEVVARLPAELCAGERVVVDAVDAVEHAPATRLVDRLVAGEAAAH